MVCNRWMKEWFIGVIFLGFFSSGLLGGNSNSRRLVLLPSKVPSTLQLTLSSDDSVASSGPSEEDKGEHEGGPEGSSEEKGEVRKLVSTIVIGVAPPPMVDESTPLPIRFLEPLASHKKLSFPLREFIVRELFLARLQGSFEGYATTLNTLLAERKLEKDFFSFLKKKKLLVNKNGRVQLKPYKDFIRALIHRHVRITYTRSESTEEYFDRLKKVAQHTFPKAFFKEEK